jgi:hypothetical protein
VLTAYLGVSSWAPGPDLINLNELLETFAAEFLASPR